MDPIEKIRIIRQNIAKIEDTLCCLSHFDGRDISEVFPALKKFEAEINNFVAKEI